eukprot:CAMPEP_0206035036 /NCGR_PEP_ID=MMETSP1466-20131121/1785_1 /ASSEMBLY_ACC=CAM_ASM_001126 /TAXON_ID=44452 /ORGANISM="Pavlova gyrans, Strain CCMP608" /LENGTH=1327 /DNA_ID=CAMNT_0053409369 /DNA_START=150 /DNA_END=4130 /DNA_ORIENTATION=+
MSGAASTGNATVTPKHVFGLKADVTDNVAYLDEQTSIFPAGHNLVIHNTEQRSQKFVPGTDGSLGIIAMAVSNNRKFVAIAERPERPTDKPFVTVYDLHTLRKRRTLPAPPPEVESRDLVGLAFSPDSKTLLTMGGAPDWTLCVWAWEKAKPPLAHLRVSNPQHAEIRQVSFSPYDNTAICVTGNGICKFCRVQDASLKPIPAAMGRREPQVYTAHAWLADDRVLVGTEAGNLLVVDSGEFKLELQHSPADGNAIEAIAAYSKGFLCASDGGVVHAYERTEERELFKRAKSFSLEGLHTSVCTLAVSPLEEQMLCSLASAQLFTLQLSNMDILKPDDMNFEPLSQVFHTGPATGLDTCVRKPLIATCGRDHTVRVWNYLERTMELSKTFTEEAHSLAFHPSGLSVLVGFADKLRLLNLLIDDIRPFKELAIRACKECRFSHGGQYFAAVNGNTIQIYATYTCDNIGNLRGHNQKVRSVVWTPDDTKLISCGQDGAVYEWSLRDFKRVGENVLKSCQYTSCACTADARAIFAVGSDKKLREIVGDTAKEHDLGATALQVVLSHSGRMLFAGMDTGQVRSFKFPLNGEWTDASVHGAPGPGAVQKMRISYDDSFLFTVGDDGCVYVCEIKDRDGRIGGTKRDKEGLGWAEEVLVTKTDLEEKTQQMLELRAKVEDLQSQNDYQLRIKELNHAEKLKEVSDRFTHEVEAARRNYELLLQNKNDSELEFEEKLRQLEARHEQTLQGTESTYQQKIMAEVERYQSLQSEKDMLAERWEEQHALLQEGHERALQELTDEYDTKLQEDALVLENVRKEKAALEATFEETRTQIEEDVDREVHELRTNYEARLAHEKNEALRLKGENGIMNKKFVSLQKEIDEQKEEISALFNNKKELYGQIQSLEKDIVGLKREIKERDETISDKEKRIYDLKKKNQELEKFKFVLDYKIKELKKQIEPREVDIMDMREQIRKMDEELERYHFQNQELDLRIHEQKLRLDGMQREIKTQRTKLSDAAADVHAFKSGLHDTIQHIQDPRRLKEKVKELYQRHATDHTPTARIEQDLHAEYARQREYLEKSVESLKRKLNKNMELHRQDNARMMQENVALIKEVNELRRDLRSVAQAGRQVYGGLNAGAAGTGAAGQRADPGGGGDKQHAMLGELRNQVLSLQDKLAAAHAEIQRLRMEAAGGPQPRAASRPGSEAALHRPVSREQLPTMEGFEAQAAAMGAAMRVSASGGAAPGPLGEVPAPRAHAQGGGEGEGEERGGEAVHVAADSEAAEGGALQMDAPPEPDDLAGVAPGQGDSGEGDGAAYRRHVARLAARWHRATRISSA